MVGASAVCDCPPAEAVSQATQVSPAHLAIGVGLKEAKPTNKVRCTPVERGVLISAQAWELDSGLEWLVQVLGA
jgi:hypothetical protein